MQEEVWLEKKLTKRQEFFPYLTFIYAWIVPSWADQLLLQLLIQQFDTCPYNVDTLNICMKKFVLEKNIFYKMTAVRTRQFFPNKAFVYA